MEEEIVIRIEDVKYKLDMVIMEKIVEREELEQ